MKNIVVLLVILLLVGTVSAIPSGTSVSGVTNNQAVFSANGGSGDSWFEYGMTPSTLNVWTPNITASGAYTWTETGSPLTTDTTYYVAGCDSSGCDASPATFTILSATPLPITTYGYMFVNATRNKFDITYFMMDLLGPYTWIFPQSAVPFGMSIVVALALFAIFFGLAMRTRYVVVPVVVGILTAPYLLYSNQGLHLGIPPEFLAIVQGIMYACMAGILLIILKK